MTQTIEGPNYLLSLMRLPLIIFLCTVCGAYGHTPETLVPVGTLNVDNSYGWVAYTRFESHYFSEGRDSLDGDSLWVNSIELGLPHLSGGIWYGRSPDQDYDELQLTIAMSKSVGNVTLSAGYTHLQFPFDNSDDNEIGAALTWSDLPLDCELSADVYHSFDSDGLFLEISLCRAIDITEDFNLTVTGLFGMNQGYVPDGHDGANHLVLIAETNMVITDSLSLSTHMAYSWALERDSTLSGDLQLIDFFHGSIGLLWSF